MIDFGTFMQELFIYARHESNPTAWVTGYPDGFWQQQFTMWENGVRDARVCDATCSVMVKLALVLAGHEEAHKLAQATFHERC